MRIAIALFATVLIPGIAFSTPRPDALTLLANVSQQYADANSYHLEAIEQQTSGSAFERNWRKMNLKAIVDSEYRYHFEV
ncbi:MAG: hypothetical protein JO356_20705, partial [Acidobacteria bacterium]|nr:hypothetical protein [Acidobacteriota bacterium]